jgi:hypothetical protein
MFTSAVGFGEDHFLGLINHSVHPPVKKNKQTKQNKIKTIKKKKKKKTQQLASVYIIF